MMQLEDVVVSGVTEFVRIYIILEYFKIFLNVHSLRRNIISCVITYIITLLSYLVFHNVLVNLIVTVAGIMNFFEHLLFYLYCFVFSPYNSSHNQDVLKIFFLPL